MLALAVTVACAHPAPPVRWRGQTGTCAEIPDWEVREHDRDLYILRQSPCASYEKPFVYLLFGRDRALLIDTGAGSSNQLAAAVVRLVGQWRERTGRPAIPLVVAHTHQHDDHTAGDAELAALTDVTVIPLDLAATIAAFGIAHWPTDTGQIDLGDRVVDVIPTPGHATLGVAFYDRRTRLLFAGDTLYPGRLYVFDPPAFEASVARLVAFASQHPIAYILGGHVEQTRAAARDYTIGTVFQPDEHRLALGPGALRELADALAAMHGKPRRLALRDFTIMPLGPGFITADELARAQQNIAAEARAKWSRAPGAPLP